MLQVISAVSKIIRQRVQKFRVSGRVRRAKIIHGIDDASSKEVTPYPISACFRKVRMRSHPLGELHPRIRPLLRRKLGTIQESGKHLRLSPGIEDDHIRELVDVAAAHSIQHHLALGKLSDSAVECRQPPELVLAPGLEWMIVALGAL